MATVSDGERATLTQALRNAADRMALAKHTAQFDAARKEHDAARAALAELDDGNLYITR